MFKKNDTIEQWHIPSDYIEELKNDEKIIALYYSESIKRLEYEQQLDTLITKRIYQLLSICIGILTILLTLYFSNKQEVLSIFIIVEICIYILILIFIFFNLPSRVIIAPGYMPEDMLNIPTFEYLKGQDSKKAITYNNTLLLLIDWNNEYIKTQARRNKIRAAKVNITLYIILLSVAPILLYIIYHFCNLH